MDDEHESGLDTQPASNVAGNPVTVAPSIGGDFTSSQSQWALVPQNTLITFQTLPFNLEQIEDTSADIAAIDQATHITSIHDVSAKLEESLDQQNEIDNQDTIAHSFSGGNVVHSVGDSAPSGTYATVVEGGANVQIHRLDNEDTQVPSQEDGLHREDFTPQIFSQISATVSSALLDAIPGSHSVLLEEVQTEVGTHLNIASEKEYTIIGSINMLLRVHNKLQAMMPFARKTRLELVQDNTGSDSDKAVTTKVEKLNKGTNCNLLVPLVSSHGREVHQPVRYSGCLQLGDVSQEEEDYRPRKHKRGRKMLQPRKISKGQDPPNKADSVADGPGNARNTWSASSKGGLKQSGSYKKNYELRTPFRYFCKMCSFKTKRESHLSRHMILHEKNMRLYPCSQCSFVAIRYSVMRRHEITHSGHGHKCDQCSYKADNSKLLLRHKRMKHTSKDQLSASAHLKCPECNYRTSHEVLYERHLQVHMTTAELEGDTLTYQCTDCEYKTNRKEHYIRHRANVHGNSRPYLCDLCGMAFKRPDTLAQHKVTHKDRKDRNFAFHCKECGKGFRSQAHLTEHSTMHSTERPYLCDHCGAAFKTQNVQKKHIQTIHLNPRSYNCDKCSKSFNTKYALRRHVRTHDTSSDLRDIGTVTIERLSSVRDADTLPAVQVTEEQTTLVQDVISASMEESYDQSSDGLRQTYSVMPNNETTTALLYLTGNLQL